MHGSGSQFGVLNTQGVCEHALYDPVGLSGGTVAPRTLGRVQQKWHQLVLEHVVDRQDVQLVQTNLREPSRVETHTHSGWRGSGG